MSAVMIVYMRIERTDWIESYFNEVPKLLTEYGALSIAGARTVFQIEGTLPVPDRIAAFTFPSLDAIHAFLDDERYRKHRAARESGSSSDIFIFENAVTTGQLI